jgi:hypothetical protein
MPMSILQNPSHSPSRTLAVSKRLQERFYNTLGCIQWIGEITPDGYGRLQIMVNRKITRIYAHRFAYEQVYGPIPTGMVINHKCRNRSCVNPAHLEVVTHEENIMHPESMSPCRINANKTHCKRGHLLHPNNRRCTQCRADKRAEMSEYRRKRREKYNQGGPNA